MLFVNICFKANETLQKAKQLEVRITIGEYNESRHFFLCLPGTGMINNAFCDSTKSILCKSKCGYDSQNPGRSHSSSEHEQESDR